MVKIYAACLISAALFFAGCSTLVKEEHIPNLKKIERTVYVMKQNVSVSPMDNFAGKPGRTGKGPVSKGLKKGDIVRLIISVGDEWIKVYAYKSKVDAGYDEMSLERLRNERYRIVYLFEEDFDNEQFNMDRFMTRLYSILKEYNSK